MTKTMHTKGRNLFLLLLAAILIFPDYTHGQEKPEVDYPKVGDTIKDHEFTDVDNFPGESFKISDFRGQWLIIDFWSRFCSGCIASFPKMNTLHRKFKDRVQLLMIGLYGYTGEVDKFTKDIYYRMKSAHELEFAVAFDAPARNKFNVGALPMIMVVNPEGVVVAKTSKVNAHQINQLLNGNIPLFKRAFSANERFKIDRKIPLLTNGAPANGGNDTSFLFRSLLVPYTYEMGNPTVTYLYGQKTIEAGKVEVIRLSLRELYLTAYFGTSSWSPGGLDYFRNRSMNIMLEVADSSDFITDVRTLKGYYSYSLIVPPNRSSEEFLKQVMQSDLRNYFNYKVSIEDRMMPAFHLVVIDQEKTEKLRNDEGKLLRVPLAGDEFFRHDVVDKKIGKAMRRLSNCLPDNNGRIPLIDKTNIEFTVSFSIEADMRDMNSVNDALADYGLKIVKGLEMMKTLVVRDIE